MPGDCTHCCTSGAVDGFRALRLCRVEYEEHPHPEGAAGRLSAPVIATVLLVATIAAIFTLPPGPVQTTTLVVAVILQVAVMITRAVIFRRAARLVDWPMRWHQFAFMWGVTSGTNFLINTLGDDAWTPGPLVVVGQQLLVSVFVVVILWLNETVGPPEWWPRHWWPRRRRTASGKPEERRPRTVQLVERPSGAAPLKPDQASERGHEE
jgi:hypothetical protein